jgi:hypothetical protein
MTPSVTHAYAESPALTRGLRWIEGDPALSEITDDVARPLETWPGTGWFACFAASLAALAVGAACVAYEIRTGIGVWGLNKTVGWAFDITNFVFWIGIGHAGTLISAILLLFRQQWRTSINRSAEAMTIFAVMCAAIFPLIHMGRPWLAFFVLPYPNSRGPLWVNFRSPLLWDVFAINACLTFSLLFWYVRMIPDFAAGQRERHAEAGLRRPRPGMERIAPDLVPLQNAEPDSRGAGDAAGDLGPRSSAWTSPLRSPNGCDAVPALLSRRGQQGSAW